MPTRYTEIGLAGRIGIASQFPQGSVADPFIRQMVVPIQPDPATAAQDTGIETPTNGVVVSGYLNVITPSAGAGAETIVIGNSTDPNGIANAVDVGVAGIKNIIVDPGMSLLGENIEFTPVANDLDDCVAELVLMVLGSDT
jgi:hypothetical protein